MKKILLISVLFVSLAFGLGKVGAVETTEIPTEETTVAETTEQEIVDEIDEFEIKEWLADSLEEHFGWLLAALGITAGALAGIIWGIIKAIGWLKFVYKSNTTTNETNLQINKKFDLLVQEISEINKNNAMTYFIAKALDEIVSASNNDILANKSIKLHDEYLQALSSKNLTVDKARALTEEFKVRFEKEAQEIKENVKTKSQTVQSLANKVKEEINKG